MIKITLLHTQAGVHQALERGDHLAAHKADAEQHQGNDGDVAHHADRRYDGQLLFGVALQSQDKMVDLIDIAGHVGLIVFRGPGQDLFFQHQPGLAQRQVFLPHIVRHIKSIEFKQGRSR
ncbi:hypothetical protein D3C75_1133930 [compost metagenome]